MMKSESKSSKKFDFAREFERKQILDKWTNTVHLLIMVYLQIKEEKLDKLVGDENPFKSFKLDEPALEKLEEYKTSLKPMLDDLLKEFETVASFASKGLKVAFAISFQLLNKIIQDENPSKILREKASELLLEFKDVYSKLHSYLEKHGVQIMFNQGVLEKNVNNYIKNFSKVITEVEKNNDSSEKGLRKNINSLGKLIRFTFNELRGIKNNSDSVEEEFSYILDSMLPGDNQTKQSLLFIQKILVELKKQMHDNLFVPTKHEKFDEYQIKAINLLFDNITHLVNVHCERQLAKLENAFDWIENLSSKYFDLDETDEFYSSDEDNDDVVPDNLDQNSKLSDNQNRFEFNKKNPEDKQKYETNKYSKGML